MLLRIIFLLIPLCSFSQEIAFKRYSVENGLMASSIHGLYFDRQQFLWITTETGVSRFDGTAFTNFTTENGLTDNEIVEMGQDAEGRIWFAGYNGTLSYLYNDSIHSFYENEVTKKLQQTGLVTGILSDKKNVWLWGERLAKINNHKYQQFDVPLLNNNERIAYVAPYKNDTLLLIAVNYIYFLSGDKIIYQAELPPALAGNVKGAIAYNGGCIIYSNHQIIYGRFAGKKFISQKQVTLDGDVSAVNNDGKGLWVSTLDEGLFYYPNLFDTPSIFDSYLLGRSIGETIWDAEGGLWVAVNGDGLYYFVNTNAYYYNAKLPAELQNSFSVTGDGKGTVYAGLTNGVFLTINAAGKMSLQSPDIMVRGYNRVKDIALLNGDTWLATDYGLFRQTSAGSIEKINNLGAVKTLAVMSGHELLVGNYEGAYIFNTKNTISRKRIFDKRTTSICTDGSGMVYMGTLNGIYTYNTATEKITFLNKKELENKSIVGLQYALGAVWAATNDGGVMALFKDTTLVFNKKNGLIGNICKSLYADGRQRIWVGTSTGLSCIHYAENNYIIKNYSQVDGLKSQQVNDIYVQNDSVWVATSAGLSLLINRQETKKTHTPPIYISKVTAQDNDLNIAAGIELKYNDNNLVFSFTGISFKSGGKMTYKYRLKGLDDDWKYTSSTQVEYASIPPGNYAFEVFACDYFGVCSTAPAGFTFSIKAPYWKTAWFIILSSMFFIGIVVLIFYRIRKNEARKNYLQKKMLQLELEAVKAQLNPHFIFNSLNSIQYFINNNDYLNSQSYLTRFARLIRNTLEYSAKSSINLGEEEKYLEDYLSLEKMRLNDRFDFSISSNISTGRGEHIQLPPMLNQIYVENAVRHGIRPLKNRRGFINITFINSADNLECIIEDNGIGRMAASQLKENRVEGYTPRGMEINRHRIDILNSVNEKDIIFEVIDKTEQTHGESGTIIKITVPLGFNSVVI